MYVGTTDGIIISPFGALWEEQYLYREKISIEYMKIQNIICG